jgi:hypothetical protein
VQTFKTKAFTRFADNPAFPMLPCAGVRDVERGLVSAYLGGGVIKQRIARPGQGKSGGFRTRIVFRAAKNEKDNLGKDELVALKELAGELLAYDNKILAQVIVPGVLVEVKCDEKTVW